MLFCDYLRYSRQCTVLDELSKFGRALRRSGAYRSFAFDFLFLTLCAERADQTRVPVTRVHPPLLRGGIEYNKLTTRADGNIATEAFPSFCRRWMLNG